MAIAFFAVWLSHALEFDSYNVTVVWPAGGISIWLILRFGYRTWLPIFLGTEIYHVFFIQPYEPLLALVSLSNTLSAVAGAWVYRRYIQKDNPFNSVDGVVTMLVAVSLVQALISALPGMLVVGYLYANTWEAWRMSFTRWFLSDVAGVIIFLPLLLALQRASLMQFTFHNWGKPLSLTCGALLVIFTISSIGSTQLLAQSPALLLSMPLCIWLALNNRSLPAVMCLIGLVTGSLFLSLRFAPVLNDQIFIYAQCYASIIISCSLILHAMTLERQKAVAQLKLQAKRLESVVTSRTADLKQKVRETQALADSLAKQSNTDYLTGINNRRAFVAKIESLFDADSSQQRYGLVLVDIDHFKNVNDRYGHAYGDKCLIAVAQLLDQYSENAGGFAGRFGGEEFACILPYQESEELVLHAQHMLKRIANLAFAYRGNSFSVTASLGVSELELNDSINAIDSALRAADNQLYAAKRDGRNRASFDRVHQPEFPSPGAATG